MIKMGLPPKFHPFSQDFHRIFHDKPSSYWGSYGKRPSADCHPGPPSTAGSGMIIYLTIENVTSQCIQIYVNIYYAIICQFMHTLDEKREELWYICICTHHISLYSTCNGCFLERSWDKTYLGVIHTRPLDSYPSHVQWFPFWWICKLTYVIMICMYI